MNNLKLGMCFLKIVTIYISVLLFSGCSMIRLKKELVQLEQRKSLEVDIINNSTYCKPVIVLVYKLTQTDKKLVAYSIHHKPGRARFLLEQGRYRG